jgi:hypothetical protein
VVNGTFFPAPPDFDGFQYYTETTLLTVDVISGSAVVMVPTMLPMMGARMGPTIGSAAITTWTEDRVVPRQETILGTRPKTALMVDDDEFTAPRAPEPAC